jgi:hypothetical protein
MGTSFYIHQIACCETVTFRYTRPLFCRPVYARGAEIGDIGEVKHFRLFFLRLTLRILQTAIVNFFLATLSVNIRQYMVLNIVSI